MLFDYSKNGEWGLKREPFQLHDSSCHQKMVEH